MLRPTLARRLQPCVLRGLDGSGPDRIGVDAAAHDMDTAASLRGRGSMRNGVSLGAQDKPTEEKDIAMKKVLGGASALALILGLSAPVMAADFTVGGGSQLDIDAGAISVNTQDQSVLNAEIAGDEVLDDGALYDGRMLFGHNTFEVQDVDVNNFNSGINAAQQGAVSIAVSTTGGGGHSSSKGGHGGGHGGGNDCACGAVALNDLDQEVANVVGTFEAGIDDKATYNGSMHFGSDTFGDQDLTVNNFNTGWNAAQQGGIAIAASTGNVSTAQ